MKCNAMLLKFFKMCFCDRKCSIERTRACCKTHCKALLYYRGKRPQKKTEENDGIEANSTKKLFCRRMTTKKTYCRD